MDHAPWAASDREGRSPNQGCRPARRARPHRTRNAPSAQAGAPARRSPPHSKLKRPERRGGRLRAHPHELRQHVVRQLHARAARLLEQVQRGAPGGRAAALPKQLELRVCRRLPRQLCGLDGLRAARGRVCRGARRAPQLWRRAPAGPCGLGVCQGAGRRPGSSRLGVDADAALSAAPRAGRRLCFPGKEATRRLAHSGGCAAQRRAEAASCGPGVRTGLRRGRRALRSVLGVLRRRSALRSVLSVRAGLRRRRRARRSVLALRLRSPAPGLTPARAAAVRIRRRAAPASMQAQARGGARTRASQPRGRLSKRALCAGRQACYCFGIGHARHHRGAVPACMRQAADTKGRPERRHARRHTARAGCKAAGTVPGARGGCGAAPGAPARGAHSAFRRWRSCVSAARATEVSSVALGSRKWPRASFR